MRFVRIFSLAVLALVIMVVGGWFWLLHTSPGAKFLWSRATAALDGAMSAAEVTGTVSGGLTVSGFRFDAGRTVINADSVIAGADIDLVPLSIRIGDARIGGLGIAVAEGQRESEGGPVDPGAILSALELPVWLRLESVTVDELTLLLPGAAEPVVIDEVGLSADWRDRIFIDRFDASAERGTIRLSGAVELAGTQAFELEASVLLRPRVVGTDDELQFTANLDGTAAQYTLHLDGEARLSGLSPLAVAIDARGAPAELDVGAFSVAGDELDVSGTASLALAGPLSIAAQAELAHADPAAVSANWPAGYPVAGSLDVVYEPGVLRLEDTRLTVAAADASLDATARIDIDAGRLEADLDWRSLSWPIDAGEPRISSSAGNIRLAGSPDDWRVYGTVSLATPGFEEGRFTLDGEGDRERAEFRIEDASVLGGRVAGTARGSWTDERAWGVDLVVEGVASDVLVPDWPGTLSGGVRAGGSLATGRVDADLDDVSGVLRGAPFRADGGVSIEAGEFSARELFVEHGDSRVDLDGSPGSRAGIAFDAVIGDIGTYLEDAAGGVAAQGRVSLDRAAPFLRIDGGTERLRIGDLHVTGLTFADRATGEEALAVLVNADDVSYGGERILAPRLVLDASPTEQSLSLSAEYSGFDIEARLAGSVDDWMAPASWQGTLQQLELVPEEAPPIELLQPAALAARADAVRVEGFCVTAGGDSRLCLDANWAAGRRLEIAAGLDGLPVDFVNRFVDTGYEFGQTVSGSIDLQLVTGRRADGTASLTITPGEIKSAARPNLVIETATGTIAFDIRDGQLLVLELDLPLPGTGSIAGDVRVSELTELAQSPIDGRVDVRLDDITLLAIFVPSLDGLDGRLVGHVAVAGTLNEPAITGEAVLTDGSADYLPLGFRARDVDVAATLHPNRYLEVRGGFRAGEGRARIEPAPVDASGKRADGVGVRLAGQGLQLVDVPDVSAIANLDLTAGFDGRTLTLDGVVAIPRARIELDTLPASKQTVSDDVVIVRGRLPEGDGDAGESAIDVQGTVALALGPSVQVRLERATATVAGGARFDWRGDPMPIANGRYVVTGEIEAFGALLEIDEGLVQFPGVPADRPEFRIRAERQIFGNTQVRSAGVLIQGTPDKPSVDPYTVPATNKERALTLLVTGSDFDYEQGVGAIDFGTYIAPRLFVSYGVNLFGRDNVISARYDITQGFGVRATSGQSESGVDLMYRFER